MKYVKNQLNRRIHIGYIASCNKNDQYGILYGFREPPYNGIKSIFENKILYFEKPSEFVIEKNTLVSYLSYDYNGFSPKVDYVYPISSLVFHHDQRGTNRDDGVYHDDKTWQLINDGIPYFDYEPSRNYCIYYPIIDGDTCRIWEGLFGCGIYMQKEAVIYELYKELKSIKNTSWPSLEEVTNTIINFKEQIDRINASEIIDTFKIMRICRYVSRPGRDDHYFEDLYQCLPNDDKYLSYLLPTKQENVFYDNDAYRSDGYKDDVIILEDETKEAIQKAKTEYSKEKHLAFLINDYYENVMRDIDRVKELEIQLEDEFDIGNAYMITSRFKGEITDELIESINQYNSSTVVGSL